MSEAEEMSQELADFIESLGDDIWKEEENNKKNRSGEYSVKYQVDAPKGLVNTGDWYRLKQCMQRAQSGEALTIGFIGGSITQGSLAQTEQTCYAYRVFEWWQQNFPNTEFRYVNAGVGGTTSQFGVARVQTDVLEYQPDVVFVEFSVNDENDEHFAETYEGLIRRIYGEASKPAVVLIHNIRYDNGVSAEEQHVRIGKTYHLPCISMKSTIYSKVIDGTIPVREITPDDLHPNDNGHALVAEVIKHFLNQVKEAGDNETQSDSVEMPAPVTLNEYENSVRYQNDNCSPKCEGFIPDTKNDEKLFKKGWIANRINDRIVLEILCTGVSVQYRKSVQGPAPVAKVTVDGDEKNAVLLDGNFDEDWGDCLYIDTIAERLENKVHTIEITIVEGGEVAVPFYLVSVIGSQ